MKEPLIDPSDNYNDNFFDPWLLLLARITHPALRSLTWVLGLYWDCWVSLLMVSTDGLYWVYWLSVLIISFALVLATWKLCLFLPYSYMPGLFYPIFLMYFIEPKAKQLYIFEFHWLSELVSSSTPTVSYPPFYPYTYLSLIDKSVTHTV